MILNTAARCFILLVATVAAPGAALLTAQAPQEPVSAPVARRIAAMSRLAAQEYDLGIENGRIVLAAEVDEAALFLSEAENAAELLPSALASLTIARLDTLREMVLRSAPPDSVTARVGDLSRTLSRELGITLEQIPASTPELARGREIYRASCASCHGALGAGDGPAGAGLDPPPADLTDARALADASPLDYYQRITIGVAGTAMPAFETQLSEEDRWAVALYASMLRLPDPHGDVPPGLRSFATTARMSDLEIAGSIGGNSDSALAMVAAVRSARSTDDGREAARVFSQVRAELDSAMALARSGDGDAASEAAFDAYMTFEQVEREVRTQDQELVASLEAGFAEFRTSAADDVPPAELRAIHLDLAADLEKAERTIGEPLSDFNLFSQSFVIMLREGLEAILIIGALVAMLMKLGARHRIRDVHLGVVTAIGASLLTAVLLETLITLTPAKQEILEGLTMVLATVVLFYVSYWLLSKLEAARWNQFVKGKVQNALTSGSALALASVAFLAVYREGFETVLFYKALFIAGDSAQAVVPVVTGMLAGGIILAIVYVAINRFGVRLPLKPFFGVTSAFLYYMAFVFAGQGIAELQEGGLVSMTIVPWAPRIPALGIYPTVETLVAQAILLVLLVAALVWTFGVGRVRRPASPPGPLSVERRGESIKRSKVEAS